MSILLFDFLNAYPYQRLLAEAGYRFVVLAEPTAVVKAWTRGGVAAALLPGPAAAEASGYLMPWGIGSAGPVQSVLLVSGCPPTMWQVIETDPRSRASVVLLRWAMYKGLLPTRPLLSRALTPYSARLVIGDEALRLRKAFPYVIDVGELLQKGGYSPVVYAVWWAASPKVRTRLLRLWHKRSFPTSWVHEAATRYGFPPEAVLEYWRGLRYYLGHRSVAWWMRLYRCFGDGASPTFAP
ncbi:MAG: hypothetical protein N3A68_02880 [Bacteroidia bacterium]|jgi:predicted solute-binding protein|nr:hypothetical protein [Bacteroidia bacterium]GIV23119.1 MAG: hypothetical protein KatS3mg025_0778 [Bacteroidia bacterium]